jgi:RHS repeat-associated protein
MVFGPALNGAVSAGTFRYTARRLDPETAGSAAQPSGLYYDRARMYSPTWGRFLQPDPLGYAPGSNLYAYVSNDPLNNTDPSGVQAAPGIVIGLVSGGTAGYIAGGWWGLAVGGVAGGVVGAVAAPLSTQAGLGAAALVGGNAVVGSVAGGLTFTAINAGAGAGATIVTNLAEGKPAFEEVTTGALVGGLAPVLSGEAVLVGMGGAAARGLPGLADYVMAAQTGVGGTLGTVVMTFKPPANSYIPTTGSSVGSRTLNPGSQKMK